MYLLRLYWVCFSSSFWCFVIRQSNVGKFWIKCGENNFLLMVLVNVKKLRNAMSLPSLLSRQLKGARRILVVKKEVNIVRKMDTWSEDKKRFLEMNVNAKRKFYKMKKYVTLDDISTWRDDCEKVHFAATNPLTNADLDQFQEFSIDSSLNKIIASKISVWSGDITELEVCKLHI